MKKIGIGCLSVLGIIFLIGIIGAIVGGNSVKKNTPTLNNQEQTELKNEEEQELFKIGFPQYNILENQFKAKT